MKKTIIRFLSMLLIVASLFGIAHSAAPAPARADDDDERPLAYVIDLNDEILPSSYDFIDRVLTQAQQNHADIVVLKLQTPGGLYESMQQIIQDILKSSVPVATFVAPAGARAASAGTYILYASHVAAMAPSTNIGAATPINMIEAYKMHNYDPAAAKLAATPQTTLEHKMVNDAAAYIRGLAQRYGRNSDWAESAVRDAVSASADEALQKHCIDLIANDVTDLLNKVDGRTVKMAADKTLKLRTKDARQVVFAPDWRMALLDFISNPSVAFILFCIGVYGLVYECFHPGAVAPGVAGVICMTLSLFAFKVLPINYAGLGLVALGLVLMVVEAFAPTFGALGVGGAVCLAVGATMLINSTDPNFQVDPWVIAAMTLMSFALFSIILTAIMRTRKRPTVTGIEELKASTAEVLDWEQGQGQVRVTGEIWMAKAAGPEYIIGKGDWVKVVDVEGLKLIVKPAPSKV